MSENLVEVELKLPVLKQGAESDCGPTPISRLQHILNDRGLGPLAEDGEFGPKTKAAVTKFQGNEGLGTDGVVGSQTWTKLLTMWLTFSEAE